MKRLYIAIAMVVLCIGLGIFEFFTIEYSASNCINSIEKIDTELKNRNYKNAEKICDKAAEDYEKLTSNVMFCYFSHNSLENISQNLFVMTETLNNRDINRYKVLKERTKKQLQAIKEEELFRIQNIL